ncbi:hypothetical protein PRUB_a0497 [Pseudoalteromonas rubra]|uniref:Uncharacterized protein n=1 Tax=Pseudoalteromonas rubra TaxID=43658 RepID=A0A8T0C5N4_9GAMM|nr:hypothetical protein PRUB_a0497 [Pseudoalteromonas rubra]
MYWLTLNIKTGSASHTNKYQIVVVLAALYASFSVVLFSFTG